MRWKQKPKIYPKDGELRTRYTFCIFPKTLNGETRWLSFSKYQETFTYVWSDVVNDFVPYLGYWRETIWMN